MQKINDGAGNDEFFFCDEIWFVFQNVYRGKRVKQLHNFNNVFSD